MSRRMPDVVRAVFDAELAAARAATSGGPARWRALERAHIVSQPWPWPRTRVHAAMIRVALHEHDRREAFGHVLRLLVAAPGSATGRYPAGNIGRSRAPLTQPMPVPQDLADLLADALDASDRRPQLRSQR